MTQPLDNPPSGLFEKIILSIKREEIKRKAKRNLILFHFLSLVSLIATVLSAVFFINKWNLFPFFLLLNIAVVMFTLWFFLKNVNKIIKADLKPDIEI